ncbi:hypothetical protein AUW17_03270 [Tenacibaculum dicentrarchi]|uniref:hypothetical protein n=1 Tax=Tenacibaculum dicentrarchi TaxID=669041 RepID=UPI000739005A|nr:hypothetical protein AUW17_03270 [Tenacibaculum dicentrarchi]
MPRIDFKTITNYLENLADANIEIASKYRWNVTEFTGNLRSGIALPVKLIDAVEVQTSGNNTQRSHNNIVAFTVLDKPNTRTGNANEYDAQNEVLNRCQNICFDIETRILHDATNIKDADGNRNWLYGRVEEGSFRFYKMGPIFTDTLYGYRCEFALKNQVCKIPDASKWNDME